MNLKKITLTLLVISLLSSICVIYVNQAASFNKYAPKLLKFEGEGYGIHKPIWGNKIFTKEEALHIHRHHYWNRFLGNHFKSQEVAEVLIDHIINAGVGRENQNIKAFERIIGVSQNGVLTMSDVKAANDFDYPEDIVNPYVEYRLRYYRSRKDAKVNKGWFKRAKSFYMKEADREDEDNIVEDYIVVPKNQQHNIVEDIK
ncbi:MAG: glycosyl hydrolase 108 family protein [Emticicia sp.]|uniref:glycosyl hydrolase 108 family protein n=1 Tax=Emticicia sp. TaxID=1930953 RepID=UPI003BA52C34